MSERDCCPPARPESTKGTSDATAADSTLPAGERSTRGQLRIPGGTFKMGDAYGEGYPADGERPVHEVAVGSFAIDVVPVTNEQFATFVDATGFVTEAERFGFGAVFHLVVAADPDYVLGRAEGTPWWVTVRGADWAHPEGPLSSVAQRADHPVVHVSWNDAMVYCRWAGAGCRPRRSGSTRPAAGSTERATRGATSSWRGRALALQHLAGRLPDQQHR